jgi:hypothetical protein
MAEGFLGRWSRRKLSVEDSGETPLLDPRLRGDDGKDAIPAPRPVIPAKAGIQAPAEQGDGPSRADDTARLDPLSPQRRQGLRGDDGKDVIPAPRPVIPAKAGIQAPAEQGDGPSRAEPRSWIPACAGMTARVMFSIANN